MRGHGARMEEDGRNQTCGAISRKVEWLYLGPQLPIQFSSRHTLLRGSSSQKRRLLGHRYGDMKFQDTAGIQDDHRTGAPL